jgi:hypothetical protein
VSTTCTPSTRKRAWRCFCAEGSPSGLGKGRAERGLRPEASAAQQAKKKPTGRRSVKAHLAQEKESLRDAGVNVTGDQGRTFPPKTPKRWRERISSLPMIPPPPGEESEARIGIGNDPALESEPRLPSLCPTPVASSSLSVGVRNILD